MAEELLSGVRIVSWRGHYASILEWPFSPLPDPPLSSPAQRCCAGEMAVGTLAVDASFRLTGEL